MNVTLLTFYQSKCEDENNNNTVEDKNEIKQTDTNFDKQFHKESPDKIGTILCDNGHAELNLVFFIV